MHKIICTKLHNNLSSSSIMVHATRFQLMLILSEFIEFWGFLILCINP